MLPKLIKISGLIVLTSLLNACLGGSIAQQIASSIATHAADKAVASALDVDEQVAPQPQQAKLPQYTEPSDYWVALATGGFRPAGTTDPSAGKSAQDANKQTPIAIIQTNVLAQVQLFNLLIGAEKNAVFDKAQQFGALNLPPKNEWPRWQVGMGKTVPDQRTVIFLIPPEFGKLTSGSKAVVELANPGDLNMLRYVESAGKSRIYQATTHGNECNLC